MVFINKQNTRVACRDGGEIPYLSMLMYSFYLMKNVKDEDVKMYIYMHLAVMWLKLFHRRCNGGILCNFTKLCIKWPFIINQPTDSLIVFCIPLLKLKLMRQEKQTHCTVNNHIVFFQVIKLNIYHLFIANFYLVHTVSSMHQSGTWWLCPSPECFP